MDKYVFDLATLIERYLRNDLSEQEENHLLEVLAKDKNKRQILDRYKNTSDATKRLDRMNRLNVDDAWLTLKSKKEKNKKQHTGKWFAYAASILLLLGIGAFFLFYQRDDSIIDDTTGKYANDVLPGKNKAILTLSNGKQLTLGDESVAMREEDGTQLNVSGDELVYQNITKKSTKGILVNTIEVPKGGVYRVILPDGSKVMLNSFSKLVFPVQFDDQERKVSLVGEAYFEVAQQRARPFKIILNDKMIEVLGTTFTVNAYKGQMTTTLIDGSVRVKSASDMVILKPGQAAFWQTDRFKIHKADLDKVQAWTKGYFYFDGDPAKDVLDQLARWYDLELVYQTDATNTHYSGSIKRSNSLAVILNQLNNTGNLSFTLKGKVLTVLSSK